MAAKAAVAWTGEPDGLVGRDETLALVRDMIAEGSRTAVVIGLPGAGKSAVLDRVRRAAAGEGWKVFTVTGHRADRHLPFAMLDDLVRVDGLPVDDPLRLRRAVLEALEAESAERPLLLVVDDAQWCDASSLSVLGFVAARLGGSQVSLVAATRDGPVAEELAALPRVELSPLTEREAALVMRRAGIELDFLARPSVIERAAGNPLALLELSRAAVAGSAGPVRSSVESLFADEIASLPDRARAALLLAAAGTGDLRILGRVVPPDHLLADLAHAERTGLVRVVDREVRFRHPLARSATYALATAQDRVAAHRALAAAYLDDPDRRVWHRAEAALVPDEGVARDLLEVADRARLRGAHVEAAQALIRAAELSPDRHDRDLRRLDAISLTLPAGHVSWIADLARRMCDDSDDPEVQARATHHLAYALAQTARQDAARRALIEAMERLVDLDPFIAMGSLSTLAHLTYSSGSDTALVAGWFQRLVVLMPKRPTGAVAAATADLPLYVQAVIDPLHASPNVLHLVRHRRVAEVVAEEPHLVAATEMALGATAWLYGETGAALERFRRAVEVMERTQHLGMLPQTLGGLAQVQVDAGLYDDAEKASRRLIDLADAGSLGHVGAVGRVIGAQVAAVRGDAATARLLAEYVLMELDVGESLAVEAFVHVALGFAAFGERDVAGCYEQLGWLFRSDGEPVHAHVSYVFLADVVAAAVRAGRVDEATGVVAVASRHLVGSVPRCRFQLARAQALVAGDAAESFHVEATTDPAAEQWPLALANARLEYGAWLRRRHRPTAARRELRAAYEVFQRLGAHPWADVARTELRAAGVTTLERAASSWDDLTAQEQQVVAMAASGMTNREIGASLYLSPRTVSAHLYNAFPKLRVTARSQLRDIVEARERG